MLHKTDSHTEGAIVDHWWQAVCHQPKCPLPSSTCIAAHAELSLYITVAQRGSKPADKSHCWSSACCNRTSRSIYDKVTTLVSAPWIHHPRATEQTLSVTDTVGILKYHTSNNGTKDRFSEPTQSGLTSVAVIQVGKLVPLVVLNEAEEGTLDVGSHLDDELLVPIQREARRYEGDVQRPTERRDGVHRLLVVEAEYGVHSSWELWTDWSRGRTSVKVC